MKELRQALSEIQSIRTQVARDCEFRGYGPASIAVSGILALLVAAVQAQWITKHTKTDVAIWLGVWAGTAAVSALLTGIETIARARRVHVGIAREMLQSAVEQFLPAVIVGALLAVVMLRFAVQADLQLGRICLVSISAATNVRRRRVVSGGRTVLPGRRKLDA
jgi:hypothetical protein